MKRRRHSTGFTLIELAIALTAGLIVAMGIVALSREATRTFHEEVRSAAAEATLRTAIDRLRADIQRAGFMSTANIVADPLLVGKLVANANPPGISDCTTYSTICNLAASTSPTGDLRLTLRFRGFNPRRSLRTRSTSAAT